MEPLAFLPMCQWEGWSLAGLPKWSWRESVTIPTQDAATSDFLKLDLKVGMENSEISHSTPKPPGEWLFDPWSVWPSPQRWETRFHSLVLQFQYERPNCFLGTMISGEMANRFNRTKDSINTRPLVPPPASCPTQHPQSLHAPQPPVSSDSKISSSGDKLCPNRNVPQYLCCLTAHMQNWIVASGRLSATCKLHSNIFPAGRRQFW